MTQDHVDRIVEQWQRERPELDPSAKHITGRVVRLANLFELAFGDDHARHGINNGDFGVLAALRRSGAPFSVTPTELARNMMMTSGGMTSAIDRLERRNLVTREANPADRRGSLVRLTDTGRRVIDAAMEGHADVEHRLVSALDDRQRRQLENLLRKLLLSVDAG